MKELAETADRVLPREEDDARGPGRGRGAGGGAGRGGRQKKEKTLQEALRESWNGKVRPVGREPPGGRICQLLRRQGMDGSLLGVGAYTNGWTLG
jgi:hypothetical protein